MNLINSDYNLRFINLEKLFGTQKIQVDNVIYVMNHRTREKGRKKNFI